MPRDGSGVYSTPPGTTAITNTPVLSTPYNGNVADVAQDLNVPRPIVAGGTGATNAKDAMIALKGEIALQIVTNFDSDPLAPGSFYAAAGATSAPVAGHNFIGIIYGDATATLTVEARDFSDGLVPGTMYVRTRNGGTWGPWAKDTATVNAAKVDRTGDTMTGGLVIAAGGLNLLGANVGLELGSLTAVNTPFIDFHSSGNANDHDVRLIATGGTATAAQGTLQVVSSAASTSPTTGALTVAGGVGISGTLNTSSIKINGSNYLKRDADPGYEWWIGDFTDTAGTLEIIHYKPADSSWTKPFGISVAGNVTIANAMSAPSKGHLFGGPSGAASTSAVTQADANIKFYDNSGGNWCGMGTDNNGDLWLRTGLIGGLLPTLRIATDGSVNVQRGRLAVNAVNSSFLFDSSAGNGAFIQSTNGSTAGVPLAFLNSGGGTAGTISYTAGQAGVSYNTTSDRRLKQDLKSFDAGRTIDATNVYDFAWKSTKERAYGIVAQEAIEVYPAAITHNKKEDWWGVDYSKYVPLLLQEIKALRARVAALEAKPETH